MAVPLFLRVEDVKNKFDPQLKTLFWSRILPQLFANREFDVTLEDVFELITVACTAVSSNREATQIVLQAGVDGVVSASSDSDVSFTTPPQRVRHAAKRARIRTSRLVNSRPRATPGEFGDTQLNTSHVVQFVQQFRAGTESAKYNLADLISSIVILSHLPKTVGLWNFVKHILEAASSPPTTGTLDPLYPNALQDIRTLSNSDDLARYTILSLRSMSTRLADVVKSPTLRIPAFHRLNPSRQLQPKAKKLPAFVIERCTELSTNVHDKPGSNSVSFETTAPMPVLKLPKFELSIKIDDMISTAMNEMFKQTVQSHFEEGVVVDKNTIFKGSETSVDEPSNAVSQINHRSQDASS